jgi:hypothetical protein
MAIGIEQFRQPRELGLDRMLLQPFRGVVKFSRVKRTRP